MLEYCLSDLIPCSRMHIAGSQLYPTQTVWSDAIVVSSLRYIKCFSNTWYDGLHIESSPFQMLKNISKSQKTKIHCVYFIVVHCCFFNSRVIIKIYIYLTYMNYKWYSSKTYTKPLNIYYIYVYILIHKIQTCLTMQNQCAF